MPRKKQQQLSESTGVEEISSRTRSRTGTLKKKSLKEEDLEIEEETPKPPRKSRGKKQKVDEKKEKEGGGDEPKKEQQEMKPTGDEQKEKELEKKEEVKETPSEEMKLTEQQETVIEGKLEKEIENEPSHPFLLEKGIIYFFYRPKVNLTDEPQGLEDVQRLLMVLSPVHVFSENQEEPYVKNHRLLVIPKKNIASTTSWSSRNSTGNRW